jgi:hypothetical protein
MRQQIVAIGAGAFEEIDNQGGARHTIYIVVTIHNDRFTAAYGTLDTLRTSLEI